MIFIMKKISAVGMLLLTVLLVLPVAAAEGKSNTHQIHAVARARTTNRLSDYLGERIHYRMRRRAGTISNDQDQ